MHPTPLKAFHTFGTGVVAPGLYFAPKIPKKTQAPVIVVIGHNCPNYVIERGWGRESA